MSNKGNKYHSTIRIEFKELIRKLAESERKAFHLYTIHRVLSLGLLIDFTFDYVKAGVPGEQVGILLNLKNHGRVLFLMDIDSNYVSFADEECKEVLCDFINSFDTTITKDGASKSVI